MNPEYKEKVNLLQSIVHGGIAKLLAEAKKKDYLDPPYGRAAFSTPLITEDQFIQDGALQSDDVEPEFKFEYGFDPLKFLSDFIVWSHPNSVEDRRQKKIAAAKFLQRRADHARLQLSISSNLSLLANNQSSGILWGPIVTPASSTSVMVSCKPIKLGKVIFQLSKYRDFREIAQREEVVVDSTNDESETASLGDLLPVKVTFKNLKPANKHFVRCCLSSNPVLRVIPVKKPGDMPADTDDIIEEEDGEGLDFKGVVGGYFMKTEFWTLPSEDRAAAEPIEPEEPVVVKEPNTHQLHRRRSHQGSHRQSRPATAQNSTSDLAAVVAADAGSMEGLVEGDFAPVLINCFGQLPVERFARVVAPMPQVPTLPKDEVAKPSEPYCPTMTCLLGDILTSPGPESSTPSTGEANDMASRMELLQSASKVLARCPLFSGRQSTLHSSSFVLDWRDSSSGSNYALRAEELAYKQFRHEIKRHKKKYAKMKSSNGTGGAATLHMPPLPSITRLPFTDSVRSILQGLPIDPMLFMDPVAAPPAVPAAGSKAKPNPAAQAAAAASAAQAAADNAKATRMMYRTIMMGPDVVLIVLDMRGQGTTGDYLGKEQSTWLDLVLQESATIQWKIILCGKTFGLINVAGDGNDAESLAAELEEMNIHSADHGGEEGDAESKFIEGTMEQLVADVQTTTSTLSDAAVSDGINENTEVVATTAVEVPVVASKQVQLPEVGDKTHAAITATMGEGLDEVYGRSLCSLQHILAVHQNRLRKEFDPYVQKSADSKVVHVTSGILLLTSGQASMCPHLVASVANHHPLSAQQDSSSPAYVAGYTNLSAPPACNAHDVEAQLLPTTERVSRRIPSELFCAEISLGQVGTSASKMRPSTSTDTFYYRDGFEAATIFSARSSTPSGNDGSEREESSTHVSPLGTVASCSLHLQTNGQLKLKITNADPASKATSGGSLFECVLEAPTPEVDEDEENED